MENIYLAYQSMQQALQIEGIYPTDRVIGRGRPLTCAFTNDFTPKLTASEAEYLCAQFGLTLPIHVLVPHAAYRRNSRYLHCHVWKGSTAAPFPCIDDGVMACPPELHFLMMAQENNIQQQVQLGFDLCGTYVRNAFWKENEGRYDLTPRTNTTHLDEYVKSQKGANGVRRAQLALSYVQDNARSPKETDLAMGLGLPCVYGGESFGMPLMNQEILLPEDGRKLMGSSRCWCDLCWPEVKLDVEYNGYNYHRGRTNTTHDRARELALATAGYKVITFSHAQLMDGDQFDVVVKEIAKCFNKKVLHTSKKYEEQRKILREVISG
ncbi:MAG: hypothetical protein Q4E12_08395 [Coriobacteriia bacterium]|nr:hypothetical protein [Coriobacteriia bacterium]